MEEGMVEGGMVREGMVEEGMVGEGMVGGGTVKGGSGNEGNMQGRGKEGSLEGTVFCEDRGGRNKVRKYRGVGYGEAFSAKILTSDEE